MNHSLRKSTFAVAAALALAAAPLHAAPVFGQEFSLNNVVDHGVSFIQLTDPSLYFDRASAFMTTPLQLQLGASIEVMFGIKILGGTDGADGMTLTFQSAGPGFVGQAGGNLGFYGVAGGDGNPLPFGPAYGVALDTWLNAAYGDTSNNGVSFLDHTTYQVRRTQASPYDLNSGAEMFIWADYDGLAKTMSVFISDTSSKPAVSLMTDSIDLPAWLGPNPYLGFTAATGGSRNGHYVTAFSLTPMPEPSTWALMVAGLAAGLFVVWRRQGAHAD